MERAEGGECPGEDYEAGEENPWGVVSTGCGGAQGGIAEGEKIWVGKERHTVKERNVDIMHTWNIIQTKKHIHIPRLDTILAIQSCWTWSIRLVVGYSCRSRLPQSMVEGIK